MKYFFLVALGLCATPAFSDAFPDYLAPIRVPEGASSESAERKIDKFIWSHWSLHSKSGFVDAVFFSKEGERSVTQAVIGPDSRGNWRVAVTILRQFSEPSCFIAVDVQKRYDVRSRRTFLVLRDADGKVITEW